MLTSSIIQYVLFLLAVTLLVKPAGLYLAVASTAGLAGLTANTGPQGFTEILFGYASCMANNGQSMAGLGLVIEHFLMTGSHGLF